MVPFNRVKVIDHQYATLKKTPYDIPQFHKAFKQLKLSINWKKKRVSLKHPLFSVTRGFYRYSKSYCWEKTILGPCYIHIEILHSGEMTSLWFVKHSGISRAFVGYFDL